MTFKPKINQIKPFKYSGQFSRGKFRFIQKFGLCFFTSTIK